VPAVDLMAAGARDRETSTAANAAPARDALRRQVRAGHDLVLGHRERSAAGLVGARSARPPPAESGPADRLVERLEASLRDDHDPGAMFAGGREGRNRRPPS
jgi:hypothetical protein